MTAVIAIGRWTSRPEVNGPTDTVASQPSGSAKASPWSTLESEVARRRTASQAVTRNADARRLTACEGRPTRCFRQLLTTRLELSTHSHSSHESTWARACTPAVPAAVRRTAVPTITRSVQPHCRDGRARPANSEELNQRLLASYSELAELAGSLAHEIKNPLSVIRMNMDLLAEDLAKRRASADRRA